MADYVKRSLTERADYHATIAKKGVDKDGKKLTEAQKANHLYKAGRLQNKAERVAKNAEYYKQNQR